MAYKMINRKPCKRIKYLIGISFVISFYHIRVSKMKTITVNKLSKTYRVLPGFVLFYKELQKW